MPRLSRDMWIVIAMLVVLIVAASLMGGGKRADKESGLSFRPTTYSYSPFGLQGLYDTLHKLGYGVRRNLAPLSTAPEDGVLFLVSPETPLTHTESNVVRDWVERGNTLVYTTNYTLKLIDSDKPPKTMTSTAAAPSFLSPGVNSFEVIDDYRITDDAWDFNSDITSGKPFG